MAEGGGIAGLLGLVLDADGDNAVERRALHADGSTIGGHPGLEIGKILLQVRVGRDERVALIADPEIRGEAADVLAHLEDALLDLEGSALAVHLVHPAHLLRHPEELGLFGQVVADVGLHARHQRGQRIGLCHRDRPLERGHAVEEGLGRAHGIPGIGGIVVPQVIPAKVLPARLAEEGHQRAERFDPQRQSGIQQALLVQPDPDELRLCLAGLGDLFLHVVLHLALRVPGQNVFNVIGRVRHKGLTGKGRAIPQVAVELEHQRHEPGNAPAIGQEVEPVEKDLVSLTAEGQLIVVGVLRDVGLYMPDADPERRVVGGQVGLPLLPDHFLEEIPRQGPGLVTSLLEQFRIHRVFHRQLIAAEDRMLPVIIHDALKNRALFRIHGRLPRVGNQVIGQVADGDKVAQLLFRDAQAKRLLQVCHHGEDLHGGQVQVVHQDAVFGDIFGRNFSNILQDGEDLGYDFGSFHSD